MMRVPICLTADVVHGYAASPKQPFIPGARLACRVAQYSWVKMDSDNGLANSNTPENDSNRQLRKRLFSERTSGSAQLPPSVAER